MAHNIGYFLVVKNFHLLFILKNIDLGKLYVSGSNIDGQLGIDSTIERIENPIILNFFENNNNIITKISAGGINTI